MEVGYVKADKLNLPRIIIFDDGESRAMSIRPRASIAHSSSISTSRSAHVTFKGSKLTSNDQMLLAEADEILNKCPDAKENFVSAVYFPQDSALVEKTSLINRRPGVKEVTVTTDVEPSNSSNVYVCPLGHNLEIEPMQVLESLNEFIGVFVPPEKQKLNNILDDLKPPDFTTLSRKLKPADIKKYWACWEEMFSSEKEQFWDGLIHGLNNYLEILQDRERIHEDVVQLRKKNSELHQLVRGVMPKSQPALPNYLTPEPDTFTSALEN